MRVLKYEIRMSHLCKAEKEEPPINADAAKHAGCAPTSQDDDEIDTRATRNDGKKTGSSTSNDRSSTKGRRRRCWATTSIILHVYSTHSFCCTARQTLHCTTLYLCF